MNSGVDYFGPFEVTIFQRPVKHWCCLFTCPVLRPVQKEVASTLDTNACLMVITSVIARRGQRHTLISDNAANFVGAARKFSDCFIEWQRNEWAPGTWLNQL